MVNELSLLFQPLLSFLSWKRTLHYLSLIAQWSLSMVPIMILVHSFCHVRIVSLFLIYWYDGPLLLHFLYALFYYLSVAHFFTLMCIVCEHVSVSNGLFIYLKKAGWLVSVWVIKQNFQIESNFILYLPWKLFMGQTPDKWVMVYENSDNP